MAMLHMDWPELSTRRIRNENLYEGHELERYGFSGKRQRKFAFPNMGDEPKVISQVSLDSFAETADSIDDGAALTVNASRSATCCGCGLFLR
ncbi:MAG: hypothetical protein ACLSUZ_07325 [Bifidobacterium pseudocatenulatum]